MKAFEATIKIRLRPKIIGPEAERDKLTGAIWNTDADACDYLSDLLGGETTILDWGYVDPPPSISDGWNVVESPADYPDYEEGEMFAPPSSGVLMNIKEPE